MKLKIGTDLFDIEESLKTASISDLILLKRATKSKDYPGVSLKTIVASMQNISDPMDFLDSEEALETFRGLIYLCRRKAGHVGTLAELTDFPLSEIEFDDEDEAEAEEEGPKAPDDGPETAAVVAES